MLLDEDQKKLIERIRVTDRNFFVSVFILSAH